MSTNDMQEMLETEERVLELCKEHKEGITDSLLTLHIPNLTQKMKMDILSKLLKKSKLKAFKGTDNELVFKLRDQVRHKKLQDADREERRVFQFVEECGDHGTFQKHIKVGLQGKKLEDILQRLVMKNVVKKVVNIKDPIRKFYILASIEPAKKITGGILYTPEGKLDREFVEALMNVIRIYLEGKKRAAENSFADNPMAFLSSVKVSTKEVLDYIISVGIIRDRQNRKLDFEDTENLLNALELDGVAESSYNGDVKVWRYIPDWSPTLTLDRTVCGVCPKIEHCDYDIGQISHHSCLYLEQWLS